MFVWELRSKLKRLGVESSGVSANDGRLRLPVVIGATGIYGALGVKNTSSSPELRLSRGDDVGSDIVGLSEGLETGFGGGRDSLPTG